MQTPSKLILAILLVGCLMDFPYYYYQFVRIVATIVFAYLAFTANEQQSKNNVVIYIADAILFQPFAKIAFGRTIWNIVDIVVATELLLSILKQKK